jgi:hypothetical protein
MYVYMYKKPRSSKRAARVSEPAVSDARVLRTYRLSPAKIAAAQDALGARTATEAIDRALDYVLYSHGLVEGTRAMLGVDIISPDPGL